MKTLCFLLLAISGLIMCPASADEPKAYRLILARTRIGSTDFGAGEYKLLVHRHESKVQIMNVKTGDVIDVPAKVEITDSRSDRTQIVSRDVNGIKEITEIRIGGTALRIDFSGRPSH